MITASMVAKEVLMLLSRYSHEPLHLDRLPNNIESGVCGDGKQRFVMAWVTESDLGRTIDDFGRRIASPLAAVLLRDLPSDVGYAKLKLPSKVDAAGAEFRGIWLRCVIDKQVPVRGRRDVWSRKVRYYDVEADEFLHGDCGIVVRLDCKPRYRR